MPSYRLSDLARRVGGELRGKDFDVEGVAPLDRAGSRELSFLTHPKYRDQAAASAAGALLVAGAEDLGDRPLLIHPEPYLALARVLELFHPAPPRRQGIDASAIVASSARVAPDVAIGAQAVIEAGATIEAGVAIGPGCVVGQHSVIGESTELKAHVVLYPRTRIGRRCLIHAGVILGGDGFGFATSGETHHKVPQVGRVVIEDDVEIGANTTIDRGSLDDTVIGAGSKIDDLVMVAHGVRLGRGTLLAAQSGIAGSTRVGEYSMFAGQSGAAGHLTLGDRTIVAAKSAALSDLPEGGFVAGIPATEHGRWKRAQAVFRGLPDLKRQVGELRRRLAELEQRLEESEDRS